MKYWLLKTEPEVFSIDDLAAAPMQTTSWEGVRNYQARNFLRDEFQEADRLLLYHSGGLEPAIVGIATVVRAGYPDSSAWDESSDYYDPKSSPANPRWYRVDIRLEEIFPQQLSLTKLRTVAALKEMELLRKGSRLSVQPVRKKEYDAVVKLVSRTGHQARIHNSAVTKRSI
jgi:predicted RNA-binding protein with PUA-like domain